MKLSSYQSFAYKYFKKFGKKYAASHSELGEFLEKGRILILPEAYAATVYMTATIMFLCFFIFGYIFIFGMYPGMIVDSPSKNGLLLKHVVPILFYLAPFLGPLLTYYVMLNVNPKSAADKRGRNIDVQLPYAVNFLAAMAATNSTPEDIFRSLATQKEIYGDVCDEMKWVYRDTKILGIDIIKSLKKSIDRAPSRKFGEFMQGIVNSLTSGRALKDYLSDSAAKYMQQNRTEQEKFIETLAFLAESYVVVGVAFPIFFMVIMVIMYWVSGSGMSVTDAMLYAVVFGGLPMINGTYIFIVKLVTPEV